MKNLTLLAAALIFALSCSAVRSASPDNAASTPFVIGASEYPFGDAITINEVHSTTCEYTEGSVLTVRGTYDLKSRGSATLYLGTTVNRRSEESSREPHTHRLSVSKGTGSFELIHEVPGPGYPHITFYDQSSGKPFGGSYFGNGSALKVDGSLGYDR